MLVNHSTNDVHPRDRVAYWREVATRAYVRHHFRSVSGASFSGTIQAGSLADLGVSTFECDPCRVDRTARDASRDDTDDIHICFNVAGRSIVEQNGRQAVNEAGSFMLLETRRPFATVFEMNMRAHGFTLPRRLLEARLGSASAFTARAIDIHSPLAKMTAAFFAMLPACLDTIDAAAASKITEQALDLIALTYSVATQYAGVSLSSPKTIALMRLKSVIDARLPDPEFGPELAAAEAGLSVRYANALLAQEGTSIQRYIVTRRLDRCRRSLEDPKQAHRLIGDIAYCWGFSDLTHFCRRFRAEFGFSPREYRRISK
jgi:AraC-like DNA-binding protein